MNACGKRICFVAITLFGGVVETFGGDLEIEIWYGEQQRFGHLGGHPQRWINVLGSVSPGTEVKSLEYRLNGAEWYPLSYHEDRKRIAKTGDFNVEILRSRLRPGRNALVIEARNRQGDRYQRGVEVEYSPNPRGWPLPYSVEWSKVSQITDVVQVVDGKWKLTSAGIRIAERYYDRVIALGDASWENYEVTTSVTVHVLTPPKTGSNFTNVTHAAIATRWPGHDPDGNQPSVKWHPLGATAEFRLGGDLSECRWRIFDGQRAYHVESDRRRSIDFETPYAMKHRVETLPNGQTRYRVKLWAVGEEEPESWDFERYEPNDSVSGSALLIAHHSDVTFGDIQIVPISPEE